MIAHQIPISAGARRIFGEEAFEVLARARELEAQGEAVIHLEVGEPDFATPAHVKAAGIAALENDQTHYTPSAGIAPLREAIAAYASRFRGVAPFLRDDVVVSPGLKIAIWNVLSVLLDPGDGIVYADPSYPSYSSCASYLGAERIPIRLREEADFRLDLDELAAKITPRTKVIVLNSPQNPTGGVLARSDLERIAELALRHDLTIVSDEIYARNLYEGEFHSIVALDGMRERTVLLDGFSKAYAMTGWRLGYAIMPAALAKTVALFGQNTYSCSAAFTQLAGIAALEGPDEPVQAMIAEFRRRRDAIVAGLRAIPGVRCTLPAGAFYVFPNISAIARDDRKLASYLLETTRVATIGGSCFGPGGVGYLRLSYANSLEALGEALRRIASALPNYSE
ncbi:MAG: pyridoxal phosphate-dependent aminotransferase [Vulcanimicrobiaceae bacterium]